VQDLLRSVPELNASLVQKYVTTADSQTVRIMSVGDVGGVRRTVWCVGDFSGGKIKVLRWREEG
jgi:hypothetical protein